MKMTKEKRYGVIFYNIEFTSDEMTSLAELLDHVVEGWPYDRKLADRLLDVMYERGI